MIDRSGELDYLRRNEEISFAGNEAGERVLRGRILGMNPELMKHAASAVVGGAIGSLMRFAVGAWFVHHHPESKFPWNTLMLNLVGCLMIGLIYGWVEDRWLFGIHLRHFLVTGVLGWGEDCFRFVPLVRVVGGATDRGRGGWSFCRNDGGWRRKLRQLEVVR